MGKRGQIPNAAAMADAAMADAAAGEEGAVAGDVGGCDRMTEKQQLYRDNAREFFRVPAHYARLEKLLARGDIGQLLYFFVKHFETNRYVRTRQGLLRVADQYRSALTSHMKRYYDFESREGRGDLVWHGHCNPLVDACEALGNAALPLPRLVAYQWLIFMDFDLYLWERFDDVNDAFTRFTLAAKERYQLASQHRRRHRPGKSKDEAQTVLPTASSSSSSSSSSSTSATLPPLAPPPAQAKRARERENMRRSRARRESAAHAAVFTSNDGKLHDLHDLVHEEEEER